MIGGKPLHLRPRVWSALIALSLLLAALVMWGTEALLSSRKPAVPAVAEDDYCVVAPPSPYDPTSGLEITAARPVPADVRCPVCGMYPARSPDWAAQVIFSNGDAQFFDSPLSLFMYLHDLPRYSPGRAVDDIVAQYVTDVSSRSWIEARGAVFVHGSTARGPMRAGNLPAFASTEAARAFAAQRGGSVLTYGAIDAALVNQLGGAHSHSH